MKKIVIISALSLFLMGCFSDESSDEYNPVAQIEVTGILPDYERISYEDILVITPEIISKEKNAEYEYMWTIHKYYEIFSKDNKIKIDTLGTAKDLNFPVNISQGNYTVKYRVKNVKNGLTEYYETRLGVVTKFSLGFYLLKEVNNKTEMDLHLLDNTSTENLIELTQGEAINEKPVSLSVIFTHTYISPETNDFEVKLSLNICTENEIQVIRNEDMGIIFTREKMFHNEPSSEKPKFMFQNYYGLTYITEKGMFFTEQSQGEYGSPGSGKFSIKSYIEGESLPSTYGVYHKMFYYYYDNLNGRFLNIDYNGTIHTFSNTDAGGVDLENLPNDLPYEMIFFGRNLVGEDGRGLAVMQDKTDPQKRYMYSLLLKGQNFDNPIESVTEIAVDSKFNRATMYASNEIDAKVIYFVTDNKLYMYDVNQNSEEPLFPVGFGTDEEITFMRNKYWSDTKDKENNFNHLVIATHKAGKYKVYMYNTLGGKPDGAPKRILEGNGKIVMMQFTSPKMDETSPDYYPISY